MDRGELIAATVVSKHIFVIVPILYRCSFLGTGHFGEIQKTAARVESAARDIGNISYRTHALHFRFLQAEL
jgi:hypothetical protein